MTGLFIFETSMAIDVNNNCKYIKIGLKTKDLLVYNLRLIFFPYLFVLNERSE